MESPEKQEITTGSSATPTPILASENVPTAEQSEPSLMPTSTEFPSTKPLSLPEALSLLQTNCFDLRLLQCEVAILARGKRLYVIVNLPDSIRGDLAVSDGHITIDGKPVVSG